MSDGIEPCVGCDETVDALYCSYSCMMDDENKVLQSPITDDLYHVTEWEEKGDGEFVAQEKKRINFPDSTDSERSGEGDDDE
jgi:hypothetical protein